MSKKGRVVLYDGRKRQLIDLVRTLVASKGRPVCSTDIRSFLRQQEETKIGYIQCFGQILIKAALPRPDPVPRLFAVGMHRNQAYYSTELTQDAQDRFERFCARERAEYLIKRGYLQCLPAPASIRTDLEKAAAASLAQIIRVTLPHLEANHLAHKFRNWVQVYPGHAWVQPEFRQVNRQEALRILKEEAHARAPYIPTMNWNRHCARICPTILRERAEPVYCEEALRSYCATIWPMHMENLATQVDQVLQWILVMARVAIGNA